MRLPLFTVATLIILMAATPVHAGTPLPDGPHVVASGEGKVTVVPDQATVTLTAQYRNADAATAKRAVDHAIDNLIKAAPGFGVATADLTASDLSLAEDFDYDGRDRRVSNGLLAEREIRVILRDLDRLGAFLDTALAGGMTRIDSVAFDSSRKEALRLQARAKAVADAREKAGGLAAAFGASLGPVYSINSVNSTVRDGYGDATTLDRIEVTGSRRGSGRYLQPTVDYIERVATVFALTR